MMLRQLALLTMIAFSLAAPAMAFCPNPSEPSGTSPEGAQVYNHAHKTMQFCDGDDWWAMKSAGLPTCAEGETIVMTSSGWNCGSGGPSSPCPITNLVHHWKLDETSGTTVADSAGGNTGTIFGVPGRRPGKTGGALDFNGVSEFITATPSAANDLITNYSITAWIWLDKTTADHPVFLRSNFSTAFQQQQYRVMIKNGGVLEFTTGDGTLGDADTFGTIPTGQWKFIACVEDNDTKKCYVDGVQAGTTQTNDVGTTRPAASLYIGRLKDVAQFDGLIDEVRFYSAALTAAQIGGLYGNGVGCIN